MDQLRVAGGVALPTRRQARRAQRLNKAGRQALHARYPQDEENCPVEAAWNATLYARDCTVYIGAMVMVWLVPIVLQLVAPNRHVTINAAYPNPLAWAAAPMGATAFTAVFIPKASDAARDRAATAACAGRTIDPWPDAGLKVALARTTALCAVERLLPSDDLFDVVACVDLGDRHGPAEYPEHPLCGVGLVHDCPVEGFHPR